MVVVMMAICYVRCRRLCAYSPWADVSVCMCVCFMCLYVTVKNIPFANLSLLCQSFITYFYGLIPIYVFSVSSPMQALGL